MMFNRVYMLMMMAALCAPMAYGASNFSRPKDGTEGLFGVAETDDTTEYNQWTFEMDMKAIITEGPESPIEVILPTIKIPSAVMASSGSAAEAICTSRIKCFEDGGIQYISYFDTNTQAMVAYQLKKFMDGELVSHPLIDFLHK